MTRTRPLLRPLAALATAALLPLAACSDDDSDGDTDGDTDGDLEITLRDAAGDRIGTIDLDDADGGGTEVSIDARDLPEGHLAFHVHGIGACEPDSADPEDPSSTGDFLSAGGHLGSDASDHGDHTGDLPSLHVGSDGRAILEFTTDRFTIDDLRDSDGSAFMVHAGPDNFANIPDRYADGGPDEETRGSGDAGDRIACAVVEPR